MTNRYYLYGKNRFTNLNESIAIEATSLGEAEMKLFATHELIWLERMEKVNEKLCYKAGKRK